MKYFETSHVYVVDNSSSPTVIPLAVVLLAIWLGVASVKILKGLEDPSLRRNPTVEARRRAFWKVVRDGLAWPIFYVLLLFLRVTRG
jgi:hypothetical protein